MSKGNNHSRIMTTANIDRPDPNFKIYRYYATILSPDSEVEMIFAYENDAIRWIKKWHEDRGLMCPPITSVGSKETGGTYTHT